MVCSIVSPALVTDLAACLGAVTPAVWVTARRQIREGDSWAVRDEDGNTLVAGGAFPDGAGGFEAWFMTSPAARARPLAVVRAVRLTMAAEKYRGIRAVVVTEAGRRIVAAAGFEHTETADGFEIWERR